MLPPEDIPLPGKFGLMAGKNSSQVKMYSLFILLNSNTVPAA